MTTPNNSNSERLRFGGYIQTLLLQVPADKVVWKTLSGVFTAEQMLKKLEAGSSDAKAWVSDIARTIRHLQSTKAKNFEALPPATPDEQVMASRLVAKGFVSLLEEYPDGQGPVYWHPMEGSFSSSEMIQELGRNSDIALAYLAGYVRIVRSWILGSDS